MKNNNDLNDYYRDFFINHNVKYIDCIEDLQNIKNVIYVTSCSKTKSGKQYAIPKEFYVSKRNMAFYSICEKNNLSYGIQSDKYGIHFSDEELEYYDVHPSSLTVENKIELGKKIADKCKQRNIENIVFCNSSPLQSRPYIEMLTYSGINYFYLSDIKILNKI